ncbi:MAG TPA: hypothetical protein VI685_01675 [Candidatus Angelobacter sp.]
MKKIKSTKEGYPHPGISMHKMPVGAGVAGFLFAVGMTVVFLMKLPELWPFLVGAIVLGGAVAVFLRWLHRKGTRPLPHIYSR